MNSTKWIQININEQTEVVNIFDLTLLLEGYGFNRSVIMRVPIPQYEGPNLSYLQINIYGVNIQYVIEEMQVDLLQSLNSMGIYNVIIQDMCCTHGEEFTLSKTEPSPVQCFRTSTPLPEDYLPDIGQASYLAYPGSHEILYDGNWNSGITLPISTLNVDETEYMEESLNYSIDKEVWICLNNILDMVSDPDPMLSQNNSGYSSFCSVPSSPRRDIKENKLSESNSLLQLTGFTSVLGRLHNSVADDVSLVEGRLPGSDPSSVPSNYTEFKQMHDIDISVVSNLSEASRTTLLEEEETCFESLDSTENDGFLKPRRLKKLWKETQNLTSKRRRAAFCYRKSCGKRLNFIWNRCHEVISEHARTHYIKPLYKCYSCNFLDYSKLGIRKHFKRVHKNKKGSRSEYIVDLARAEDMVEIEKLTRNCFPHYYHKYGEGKRI